MIRFTMFYGEHMNNIFTTAELSGHLTKDVFHGFLIDMELCAKYFGTNVELWIDNGCCTDRVFLTVDKGIEPDDIWHGVYRVNGERLPIRTINFH